MSKIIYISHSMRTPLSYKRTDTPPTLEEMQKWVDGDIEVVSVLFHNKPCQMIVNESGALDGRPVNIQATSIYHCASITQQGRIPFSVIHGKAILLDGLKLD